MSPGKVREQTSDHSDQESGHTGHDDNAGHLNGSGEKPLERLEFYAAIGHGKK